MNPYVASVIKKAEADAATYAKRADEYRAFADKALAGVKGAKKADSFGRPWEEKWAEARRRQRQALEVADKLREM